MNKIEILSKRECNKLREAGRAAAEVLDLVCSKVCAGMSTADIDALVVAEVTRRKIRSSQLGYEGFSRSVCTSRNDVVCHGIPSPKEFVEGGDIINIDVTVEVDGFHGDTSRTLLIGEVCEKRKRVTEVAERALQKGIDVVRPGARLGDIGFAIQSYVEAQGMSVVREFGGHGIGRLMHMAPHISHFGKAGRGLRLQPGMAFTIEPMVNAGGADVEMLDDGWTVVTAEGCDSAQFEHTLLVVEEGVEVLTRTLALSDE